jgi:hypothetical protein
MKPLKDIPKFKTEKEEADFWALHDTADFFDLSDLKEVSFTKLKEGIQRDAHHAGH